MGGGRVVIVESSISAENQSYILMMWRERAHYIRKDMIAFDNRMDAKVEINVYRLIGQK